jgi:AcrR family transcriptional regulator
LTDETKKKSWKKLPESVRRESILKAAQVCFAKRGYSDTSVSDIAKESGLTKGGIYFHFASKDEIRLALLREFAGQVLTSIQHIKEETQDPENQLRALLTLLLNKMGDEEGLLLSVTEAVIRHQSGIEDVRFYYQQVVEEIGAIIQSGRAAKTFQSTQDVELVVELLLTSISGLALHREMDRAGIHLCNQKNQMIDYLISIVKFNY